MAGLKQYVLAIPAQTPVPSLLTVARPLSGLPAGASWKSGVAWQQGCNLQTFNWPLCPAGGSSKTLANGAGTVVATEPVTIYTGLECDYPMSETGDELDELARAQVEASSARGLGAALWMGDGLTTTADPQYGLPPTLRRVGHDVSANLGGSAALLDVVAELLWQYEQCTYGAGGAVLHMPTILLPGALGGLAGGGRVAWPEGNFYRGPAGSYVSGGPGYPHGHYPDGATAPGPLVSGSPPNEVYRGNGYNEAWVYVSGPVEYALGDIDAVKQPNADTDPFAPNPRQNRYTVVAERQGIVRFDPCCVYAARALVTIAEVS